jgi:hypothetical protein
MKVTLDFEQHKANVVKEPGDPYFKNGGYAGNYARENRFFYWVKNTLRKQGYDVIKKNMGQDGHLTEDKQPYVRTRKMPTDGNEVDRNRFMIWYESWAIDDAGERFNKDGKVTLLLEW